MKSIKIYFHYILIAECLFFTSDIYSQNFTPQIDISLGGGVNMSYFDIGSGSPGYSVSASTMYQWSDHWKAGIQLDMHNVVGTDEGTAFFSRGLAYNSYIFEFTGRAEYIFYLSTSWKSKWKQKLNSRLPYGGTWKRRVKPFLYAGAGVSRYTPYIYSYSTGVEVDGPSGESQFTPVINGGFGLYITINRSWNTAIEAGTNFPFFDYSSGYREIGDPNTADMIHYLGIRLTYNHPVLLAF